MLIDTTLERAEAGLSNAVLMSAGQASALLPGTRWHGVVKRRSRAFHCSINEHLEGTVASDWRSKVHSNLWGLVGDPICGLPARQTADLVVWTAERYAHYMTRAGCGLLTADSLQDERREKLIGYDRSSHGVGCGLRTVD